MPCRTVPSFALLQGIYRELGNIEGTTKSKTPTDRRNLRKECAAPVWSRMRELLPDRAMKKPGVQDKLAEALQYLKSHWTALQVPFDDPLMPIDNNEVEQLMKRVTVGTTGTRKPGQENSSRAPAGDELKTSHRRPPGKRVPQSTINQSKPTPFQTNLLAGFGAPPEWPVLRCPLTAPRPCG